VSWASFKHLGPYRLLNVVNVGQTSLVWRACDEDRKQFFAIKTLQDEFLADREQVRFLRWEYTVGHSLDHPRIIRFYDQGTVRRLPYVVMEWFDGINMKQLCRQGLERFGHLAPKILIQATEAVSGMNEAGWVHRDIKPENFLVSKTGDVKLIDFALARRIPKGLARFFSPKTKIQGTRSYMSPEQIRGRHVDSRADLYSLACSLFELLVGRPPFTGASAHDLLIKHLKAAPPNVEAYNRNVTPEFSQLLRQALAKKPANRPASTQEFLKELRGIRVFRREMPPPEDYEAAPSDQEQSPDAGSG